MKLGVMEAHHAITEGKRMTFRRPEGRLQQTDAVVTGISNMEAFP